MDDKILRAANEMQRQAGIALATRIALAGQMHAVHLRAALEGRWQLPGYHDLTPEVIAALAVQHADALLVALGLIARPPAGRNVSA